MASPFMASSCAQGITLHRIIRHGEGKPIDAQTRGGGSITAARLSAAEYRFQAHPSRH
jgi:hypothetical protein